MKTSIQAIIALVLVLIVVIGIFGVVSGVFNDAGQNIKKGGNESGSQLDCVLKNPSEAERECRENSDLEVEKLDVRKA